MSETITATFGNDYDCACEATKAAAPFMESATIRRVRNTQSWTLFALAVGGLFAVLYALIGPISPISLLLITAGSALAVLALPLASGPFEKREYQRFCETPFGSSATVTINADGFDLTTKNSQWFTGWGDITEIFMTTNTVGIITPSMPIYVPKAALNDPQATFKAMRRWHKDAKA